MVNASLAKWPDLSSKKSFSGILVGNGASRVIWEDFQYNSLYTMALDKNETHSLSASDKELFEVFETTNFELVLSALSTTKKVGN
jgi:hypothetical protein